MFNQKIKDEFFVFINNNLHIYHTDGSLIQQRDFDYNIVCGVQDEDSMLLAYDNGTLACYDWYNDKVVDEWEKFGKVKVLAYNQSSKEGGSGSFKAGKSGRSME